MHKFKMIVGAVALATTSLTANAVPMTFFAEDPVTAGVFGPNASVARNTFLGKLSGVGTQDFEALTNPQPFDIQFPGTAATLNATLGGTISIANTPLSGRFATSGRNFLTADTGNFSISFATAINAFGFNGMDIGDFVRQQMKITLTDTNDRDTVFTVPHSLNIGTNAGATLFWGFIDAGDSYKAITFSNAGGGDTFAFDDMVVGDLGQIVEPGNTVPLPGSLALFGLGLAGLATFRRRKPT